MVGKKNRIQLSVGEKAFDVANVMLMIFLSIITLFPFWLQLCISFSSKEAVLSNLTLLWPKDITLETYKLAFEYKTIWTGYRNTIIRSVLAVPISVLSTALFAYPLSIKSLPFRKQITGILLFTMMFNGGLIPNYLLIHNLNIDNTVWALVLPGSVGAFHVLLMRNFFMSIPYSLQESARIDGASILQTFTKIIIPLSTPIIATISLFTLVGHWNEWFAAMLYIRDIDKQVLQAVLRHIVIENNMSSMQAMMRAKGNATMYSQRQLQATIIMLSTIPMLMVYPYIQKYFVKGIMIGAVKG